MMAMPHDVLDPLDVTALERCVEIASRDPDRAEQLRWKLADGQPWASVAAFASFWVQGRSLRLKPWEVPPCTAIDARDTDAHRLLRKMLRAGLSRYEPDPIRAMKKKSVA
jgi:hypothetical protein